MACLAAFLHSWLVLMWRESLLAAWVGGHHTLGCPCCVRQPEDELHVALECLAYVDEPVLRGPLIASFLPNCELAMFAVLPSSLRGQARFIHSHHGRRAECAAGRCPVALPLESDLRARWAWCTCDVLPCPGLPVSVVIGWLLSVYARLLLSLPSPSRSCRLLPPHWPLIGLHEGCNAQVPMHMFGVNCSLCALHDHPL